MTGFGFLLTALFFQDPLDQNIQWQKGKVIRETNGETETEVRYISNVRIDRNQHEVITGRIDPYSIPAAPLLLRWFRGEAGELILQEQNGSRIEIRLDGPDGKFSRRASQLSRRTAYSFQQD